MAAGEGSATVPVGKGLGTHHSNWSNWPQFNTGSCFNQAFVVFHFNTLLPNEVTCVLPYGLWKMS